jgi:hypothetical protein
LSAGNNVNLLAIGAIRTDGAITATAGVMTTTSGNITVCAGNNINIDAAVTLTSGSSIPAQSLGLATGRS